MADCVKPCTTLYIYMYFWQITPSRETLTTKEKRTIYNCPRRIGTSTAFFDIRMKYIVWYLQEKKSYISTDKTFTLKLPITTRENHFFTLPLLNRLLPILPLFYWRCSINYFKILHKIQIHLATSLIHLSNIGEKIEEKSST